MSKPRLVDKQAVLAAHEFFRGLTPSAIEKLASHARSVDVPAGTRIFCKGDPGHGLLASLSGLVKISTSSANGREIVLNLIGPNEVFGEIALLDGGPRTADATAVTRCQLLVLDRRDILPLLEQDAAIGIRLLEVVTRRLRRTSEQVEDLSFEGAPVRLAKTLLQLAEVQNTRRMPRPRILITQKALGQTVGLSRETINKHLQAWRHAGLISIDKGACILLEPELLRQFTTEHQTGCVGQAE
jgi:CRP/FNR family transcriptional regulator, cyclic AMP receptor protein